MKGEKRETTSVCVWGGAGGEQRRERGRGKCVGNCFQVNMRSQPPPPPPNTHTYTHIHTLTWLSAKAESRFSRTFTTRGMRLPILSGPYISTMP